MSFCCKLAPNDHEDTCAFNPKNFGAAPEPAQVAPVRRAMNADDFQKAKNYLEERLAAQAGKAAGLPICEAAYMPDGRVLVGYTNRDENGGFTPVADITVWFQAREARLLAALEKAEREAVVVALAAIKTALSKAEGK